MCAANRAPPFPTPLPPTPYHHHHPSLPPTLPHPPRHPTPTRFSFLTCTSYHTSSTLRSTCTLYAPSPALPSCTTLATKSYLAGAGAPLVPAWAAGKGNVCVRRGGGSQLADQGTLQSGGGRGARVHARGVQGEPEGQGRDEQGWAMCGEVGVGGMGRWEASLLEIRDHKDDMTPTTTTHTHLHTHYTHLAKPHPTHPPARGCRPPGPCS